MNCKCLMFDLKIKVIKIIIENICLSSSNNNDDEDSRSSGGV